MLKEKATYWRQAGLDMLYATFITHAFAKHFHETYAIGMIERGHYTFFHRSEMKTICDGQIVVINPGEIHTGEAVDRAGWTYRMFYPEVDVIQVIAEEMTGKPWTQPFFPSSVITDQRVAQEIRYLHRLLEQPKMRLAYETQMRVAFGLLIQHHAVDMPSTSQALHNTNQVVYLAREYLHAHYAENIGLEDVANACGVSPFHLVRIFRQSTGLPPHKYLINLRVMKARAMLERGVSIADAAAATGFVDQSHMTRWFKRIVGISPGKYEAGTH